MYLAQLWFIRDLINKTSRTRRIVSFSPLPFLFVCLLFFVLSQQSNDPPGYLYQGSGCQWADGGIHHSARHKPDKWKCLWKPQWLLASVHHKVPNGVSGSLNGGLYSGHVSSLTRTRWILNIPCHLVNVRDLLINKSLPMPHNVRVQEHGQPTCFSHKETTGSLVYLVSPALDPVIFGSFLLSSSSCIHQSELYLELFSTESAGPIINRLEVVLEMKRKYCWPWTKPHSLNLIYLKSKAYMLRGVRRDCEIE